METFVNLQALDHQDKKVEEQLLTDDGLIRRFIKDYGTPTEKPVPQPRDEWVKKALGLMNI